MTAVKEQNIFGKPKTVQNHTKQQVVFLNERPIN